MAASKKNEPAVTYRHNAERERHEIGVDFGGVFVPFAQVDDYRVTQIQADAESADASSSDDESEG